MADEPSQSNADERQCLACGYNLYGLGEEPRCPECGLQNIPDAFRRQVWELVDSGKWFFSGFFSPFKKRPPGWWWALDRPGDIRRAVRFAAASVVLSTVLLCVVTMTLGSICIEFRYQESYLPRSGSGTQAETVDISADWVGSAGVWAVPWESKPNPGKLVPRSFRQLPPKIVFHPDSRFAAPTLFLIVGVLSTWAGPAAVGLWTQIRKGLPDFARAPRTILAASCYEAHRLFYLVMVVVVWAAVDAKMRLHYVPRLLPSFWPYPVGSWILATALITIFGALGWVGAIRSDYTRQLVQSKAHAVRIVMMYAVFLPWTLGAMVLMIFFLLNVGLYG